MLNVEELDSYHKEDVGRMYVTPRGHYPSVTTVLSAGADKSWLEEWRKRVGEEEADRIVKESTDIGSHMHLMFENYFQNIEQPVASTPEEETAERMFRLALPKAKALVGEVLGIEVPVYSHKLRIAGRFDFLAKLKDGRVALIDWKNSKRDKSKKDINDYRRQTALYRQMIKETLDIECEEMIIFMVLREGFVKVFRFSPEETPFEELVDIRKKFYKIYGF